MAEYIDKKKVIQEINDWWKCAIMADGKPTLNATIKALPTADVIERSKIDKAIAEIDDLSCTIGDYSYSGGLEMALEILKRNIGE